MSYDDGYVCDGCGAIMKDVYAYVDGEPTCRSCAGYILADDSHLVRCPDCKRIIDRCLRPGKCILCQLDNIDAEIAAINQELRTKQSSEDADEGALYRD